MGWALDGGEDIGGQFADHDFWLEREMEIEEIKENRKHRVKELTGKFVVASDGKGSGKVVFYQDRKISSKGYWTQYLSNALGFHTLDEAKSHANGFKFNNPRVAIVTSKGNYQWIK